MNHGTLSVINLFQFAVDDDNHVKAKRTRLSPEFPNDRPLIIYHQPDQNIDQNIQ